MDIFHHRLTPDGTYCGVYFQYNDSTPLQEHQDHGYTGSLKSKKRCNAQPKQTRPLKEPETQRLVSTMINLVNKDNKGLLDSERSMIKGAVHQYADTKVVAATILTVPQLREEILKQVFISIGRRPESMKRRKHGKVHVFMRKGRSDLEGFDMKRAVDEMAVIYPELLQVLLHLMLPQSSLDQPVSVAQLLPRLAMVYSIIMKSRNHELSAMQRVVSLTLMDNICDQKVGFGIYVLVT